VVDLYFQTNFKETYNKLEMVFKRENHKFLLQKQFMQLIQGNPKIKTPMLYLTHPEFAVQIHEIILLVEEKKILRSWKWFLNVKTMNLYFKNNLCNEFKGIQKLRHQSCI